MSVSTMENKEFNALISKYRKDLNEIKLPPDINPVTARFILSQLDNLYTNIRFYLSDIESTYQRSESIIRENERIQAVGKNEEERKRNASSYLANFPIDDEGETTNMYEWNRTLRTRYELIQGIVDVITNKQQRLITMNGFLKIDKEIGSQYGGDYHA